MSTSEVIKYGNILPIHWATENSAWLSLAKHISIHTHQLFLQSYCQGAKTHEQELNYLRTRLYIYSGARKIRAH